jgi:hypothetical protein
LSERERLPGRAEMQNGWGQKYPDGNGVILPLIKRNDDEEDVFQLSGWEKKVP